MKRLLLCTVLSFLSLWMVKAQLNEGFENAFPPEEWTIYPDPTTVATNVPRMERVTYSSVSDFKTYILGYHHGGTYVLQSVSGGFGLVSATSQAKPTDNWLITPQITVGDNQYLNFMLGANCSHNNGSNHGTFQLEVAVSENGKDTTEFKDVIYHKTTVGVLCWSSITLDLSKYKGKKIYVAFHDYGTYIVTNFVTNRTYIDDVKIIDGNRSDLSVTSVQSPVMGCATDQPVSVTLKNTGAEVSSFDVSFQVGTGAIVKETIHQTIKQDSTLTVALSQHATLKSGEANDFKVWVSNASVADANLDNDTLTTSIKVGAELAYPYTGTVATAQTDFAPSSSYNKGGWAWYATDECWKYTKQSLVRLYLLESNCVLLPKGQVRVVFEYKSSASFTMAGKLGEFIVADYTDAGASQTFPMSLNDWVKVGFTLNVPEAGLYSVGLLPTIVETSGDVLIRNVSFCDPYDDMSVQYIANPLARAQVVNSLLSVSASFKNQSDKALTNVPVYYQLGNNSAKAGVIANIAPEEEVTYTFNDKMILSTAGSYDLKVWSALANDGDHANDSVAQTIYVYQAEKFPYTTGFEDENDYYHWSPINIDRDLVYWGVISGEQSSPTITGSHSAYVNSFSGVEHNDWMVSPAISMPKGKARISFYYMCYYATGATNLKVYMGTSPEPKDMTTLLTTVSINNPLSPKMGLAYVDIETAGNYYFGFYDEGLGRDIILDNIHIDAAEDMQAVSTEFDVQTNYELTTGHVLFTVKNCGLSDRVNIPVSYSVNEGTPVHEVIPGPVKVGETYTYTFAKQVNFSEYIPYKVVSTVSDAADVDSYNNSLTSPVVINNKMKEAPCVMNFEDLDEIPFWQCEGKWLTGTNFLNANAAYDGKGAIQHKYAAVNTNGDWAFSAPIKIAAGTYDFSYFFRTMLNNSADKYKCSFKVYLGTSPKAEDMTLLIDEQTDVTVIVKQYQKVLKSINVDKTGTYYIGICYTGTTASAILFMDCFTIAKPVTEGLSLPYTADFANREDEWYHYNPATSHFEQWTAVTDAEGTFMKTQLTSVAVYASRTYPGVYRSPAFSLNKGDVVKATFDYSIINSTVTDTEEQFLSLYMADKDMPDAFTTLVAQGNDNIGEKVQTSGEVTIPDDGIYYFGYTIATPIATQAFNLYSLKLEKTATALDKTNASTVGVYVAGKMLHVTSDYDNLQIMNLQGVTIGVYANQRAIDLNSLTPGVYVVSVEKAGATTMCKVVVK